MKSLKYAWLAKIHAKYTHFVFRLFVNNLNFGVAIICELIAMKARKGQRHIMCCAAFLFGQFIGDRMQSVKFPT